MLSALPSLQANIESNISGEALQLQEEIRRLREKNSVLEVSSKYYHSEFQHERS